MHSGFTHVFDDFQRVMSSETHMFDLITLISRFLLLFYRINIGLEKAIKSTMKRGQSFLMTEQNFGSEGYSKETKVIRNS